MTEKEIRAALAKLQNREEYRDLNRDLEALNEKVRPYRDAAEEEKDALLLGGTRQHIEVAQQKRNAAQKELEAYKRSMLEKYGETLYSQLDSFFLGPEDSSDEKVLEWITENYLAARLCISTDVMTRSPEFENVEDSMHAAAQMVKPFLVKYQKDSICWGSDAADPEPDYAKSMATGLNRLAEQWGNGGAERIEGLKKRIEEIVPVKEAAKAAPPAHKLWNLAAINHNRTDRERFDDFAVKLKNAATTFNSDEYKSIISTLKGLNMQLKAPGTEKLSLSPENNQAAKLFILKQKINEYLEHKGRDGVKKNVYNKLAVVEELNEYITKRIEELDPKLRIGDDTFTVARVHEEFEKAPAEITNQTQRRAVNCMGRIVKLAERESNFRLIPELNQMRQEFIRNPGPGPAPQAAKSTSKQAGQ